MDTHEAAGRGGITMVELAQQDWRFSFKQDHFLSFADAEQIKQRQMSDGGMRATFNDQGKFRSNIAGAPSQRRPLRYHLCTQPGERVDEDGEGVAAPFVQVGAFPTLAVSRTNDLRWCLESELVVMISFS